MGLAKYRRKRDFTASPEPTGAHLAALGAAPRFVVQKHEASRLHYDFRLEVDGVLKSWAVPKGPSLDPHERRLAVETEDHPLEYATFEGVIPKGQYGGGTVLVWDRGVWSTDDDASRALANGKLTFRLAGEKLHGEWSLVRMPDKGEGDKHNWLLIKKHDNAAREGDGQNITQRAPKSAQTDRTLHQIAAVAKNGPDEASDFRELPGAKRGKLPDTFRPQLATLVDSIPESVDWVHELKYDGYRLIARCDGDVKLFTRQGNDWTDRFTSIAEALKELPPRGAILDGEVVVLDKNGASDFQALQNVLRNDRASELLYYVFDLPFCEGYDLTGCAQLDRKETLRRLLDRLPANSPVKYSDHIRGQGDEVHQHSCRHDLEGVISKRADAPYSQRRSRDWVKVKCKKRQEFVIGGWTDPSGSRVGLGALLLGVNDGGKLVYCGRVGTGFNSDSLSELRDALERLPRKTHPFASRPPGVGGGDIHWVTPQLVAEIEFAEWTSDGLLRHPSFKGLRLDKPADAVKREKAKLTTMAVPKKLAQFKRPRKEQHSPSRVAGVEITHPERVVYPEQGVTKGELAQYYADVAEWILPFVAGRPLTIVRCPGGRSSQCFYQKHATDSLPAAIGRVEIEEDDVVARYVTIDDANGLVSLVQMGTLEMHPWGSRHDRLERPDVLVFDLDPGEGVPWKHMIEGSRELRSRFNDLGLASFLRTTGGKGLHVVAPIERRTDWPQAKSFARRIAESMAADTPKRYVDTARKNARKGKIYVDYLRNSRGATAIASYSTRARAGAPVATPLEWDELDSELNSSQFNVTNVRQRLAKQNSDPWAEFHTVRQSLTKKLLKKVGVA